MKLLIVIFTVLFLNHEGFCQLTVKPTSLNRPSYFYVNESLLFVSEGVHLEKNPKTSGVASIYLRNGAQLVQGHEGISKNTGDGLLSVFQEGTSNAFDYNYWAAPVRDANNGYFGIKMLYAPQNKLQSIRANITNNLNGTANPLMISSRWIYTYSGTKYSHWNYIGNKVQISPGYGFSMKGVNGTDPTVVNGRKNNPGNTQRYDFRGAPNSGTISIPISNNTFVLVGNPYPSAFDLSLFLIKNSGSGNYFSKCYGNITRKNAITGIAYFWDSKKNGNSHYLQDYVGGYGAFSPVDPCTTGVYERPILISYGGENSGPKLMGNHYERRYAPIAQGFMVKGAANAQLKFTNQFRIFKKEGNYSDFKNQRQKKGKVLKVIPKIRLQVEVNGKYTRFFTLAFWKTATREIDIAMDAQAYKEAPIDVGWFHNGKNYSIDVRPYNPEEEIPLFVKVEDSRTKLKFSLNGFENFSLNELYLHDLVANVYYPLKESQAFIILEPGIYHHRFTLSFRKNSKILDVVLPTDEKIKVFQNNPLGRTEIKKPSNIKLLSVRLFDLSGKLLFEKTNFRAQDFFSFSTKNLVNSIYILKIIKQDFSEVVKKITVLN